MTDKKFEEETEMDKEPLVPETFDVDLRQWEMECWKGRNFVNIKLNTQKGEFNVILWPSEANCLMDMLKQALDGVDISYDAETAFTELREYRKAHPED